MAFIEKDSVRIKFLFTAKLLNKLTALNILVIMTYEIKKKHYQDNFKLQWINWNNKPEDGGSMNF
jgi:hypothetical protein